MNSPLRATLLAGLLAVALAACSAAAAPAPADSSPAASDPPTTLVPDSPVVGDGGAVGMDPQPGQPQFFVPKPGTLDPHPVGIDTLEARVEGRAVTIVATWYSGIEPCNVLDSAFVKKDGNAFTVALTEGTGDPKAMCIEIAVQKATAIDLGELAPGEYTVAAQDGTAPPITFTVA